ncbi:MAG: pyridoxal phosphate-dependent aminotransferase [Planctomycetota bacterium]|jgi:aspartate aminotransferase|nr:pyridoxal phosphate-dependent aminotransferase [Planctomycetota bacterium]
MPGQFLSRKVLDLSPSATIAMNAKAKKLRAQGKDVISLSVGEPDFRTPRHICEAAMRAVEDGQHFYTPSAGTPELRQAVADTLSRDTGASYSPDMVVVSPGAKYSIYLTLLALLDPGDEVLIPAPYWVSYPEIVRLCGGVPVLVATDGAVHPLSPAAVAKAITPRSKLLILNSPSNPSGQVVPPEDIGRLGALIEERGIWCLSDEVYNRLSYGREPPRSIAGVSPYCHAHTVVVNGCSKTYAMTGWRLGWLGARRELAAAVDSLQSQTTSNPSAITQAAALAALQGPQDCVEEMRREFQIRRDLIHRLVNALPGFSSACPEGAFYVFPDISQLLGREIGGRLVNTPSDFCEIALERALVAMVSGEPFGTDRHVRISFAVRQETLSEACRRLGELLATGRVAGLD